MPSRLAQRDNTSSLVKYRLVRRIVPMREANRNHCLKTANLSKKPCIASATSASFPSSAKCPASSSRSSNFSTSRANASAPGTMKIASFLP